MSVLLLPRSPEIEVYKKLRVGYFSTGNELRSPGQELDEGCTIAIDIRCQQC